MNAPYLIIFFTLIQHFTNLYELIDWLYACKNFFWILHFILFQVWILLRKIHIHLKQPLKYYGFLITHLINFLFKWSFYFYHRDYNVSKCRILLLISYYLFNFSHYKMNVVGTTHNFRGWLQSYINHLIMNILYRIQR